MVQHTWKVIEYCELSREVKTPHSTYLSALLYLVRRSHGYRGVGTRADILEYIGHDSALVKSYTGQKSPSEADVKDAVLRPERFQTFVSRDHTDYETIGR